MYDVSKQWGSVAATHSEGSFKVLPDLFEQPPLLDDVRDGFLLNTTSFVDVFEGVKILRLLVLNDSDLWWHKVTNTVSTQNAA
jgi:hypothetical protein